MNRHPNGHQDPGQQKRMLIAIVLSLAVLFIFHFTVERPRIEAQQAREAAQQTAELQKSLNAEAPSGEVVDTTTYTRDEVVGQTNRFPVSNEYIDGTISTKGLRIDDLRLLKHYETVERINPVALFSPSGTEKPYYAEFGFIAENKNINIPDENTQWQIQDNMVSLGEDKPVIMRWDNGQGLTFERKITLNHDYLFTVTDRVMNTGDSPVTLYPYQLVSRKGLPDDFMDFFILHQGPISYSGGELEEMGYDDLEDSPQFENTGGWIGFTDKYWAALLIPENGASYKARFVKTGPEAVQEARYQADMMSGAMTILPGQAEETTTRMFAGEKRLSIFDEYRDVEGLRNLDLSIDFGIWAIITKPLYIALNFLSELFGHVGWGIIVLTVLLRLLMFPLNSKSFRSMAAMKKIAPKLKEIQEKHKGDQKAMQMKIMELYQREKVNPLSGCWPMLLQIPIFFALYKVVMLDIDMRHAPFPGWIEDMSVMDPTTVFNLFGLLPYEVPGFLMIGAWPILMGMTMAAQRRLNPPPTDPIQAKLIKYMPFFFVIILAKFAAGLVIYWTWSNFLGLLQQYTIMRREGVDVSLIKGYKKAPVEDSSDDK